MIIEQIIKQVEKLVDVMEIIKLSQDNAVYRELALMKISANASQRSEIITIADIFRANIVDVANSTLTVEMTGDQSKITAFMELMAQYGIKEMVRTGLTGLQRGSSVLKENMEANIVNLE